MTINELQSLRDDAYAQYREALHAASVALYAYAKDAKAADAWRAADEAAKLAYGAWRAAAEAVEDVVDAKAAAVGITQAADRIQANQ